MLAIRILGILVASGAQGANLQGVVTFNGQGVPVRELAVGADPLCAAGQIQGTLTVKPLQVTDRGGVAGAFVYVKGDLPEEPAPSTPLQITIQGCQIRPPMLGIRVGQPLQILNEDSRLHALSFATHHSPPIQRGIKPKSRIEVRLTAPETQVPIESKFHGWSRSYLHVLEHPYYAVTDSEGRYSIPNLPPGSYEVVAWHPSLGPLSHPVKVASEGTQNISFTFLRAQ